MTMRSSNMLPRSRHIRTSCCVALLLLAFCSVVHSQRTIVDLGKKLHLLNDNNGSSPPPSEHHAVQDDKKDDEVAVRDSQVSFGSLEKVDLAFDGIKLLLEKKGRVVKTILDGSIRGRVRPGRMLAIMGPSGSGKSSVLHALAGRMKSDAKLRLYGQRFVNGEPVDGDVLLPAAFVEQGINFFPHMTVRETLRFRVDLKLGSHVSKHRRVALVHELLTQLGLLSVADTIVGNAKVRGISGGEQKRLSIAVEMIDSPALIFLDEPTSGLDSTAATKLIDDLHELATKYSKTIVAVIHQPSQHVFSRFDDLLLLAEGRQMYFGERQHVRAYLSQQGFAPHAEIGTAEHVLDCITRLSIENNETAEQVEQRMNNLAGAARKSAEKLDLGIKKKSAPNQLRRFLNNSEKHGPRASVLIQLKLLLNRSFREVFRSKSALMIKTVQQVTLGLIYGGIYSLGDNQASIQDRFGLISLIAIGSTNMALGASVRSFPREKAIISLEIASKMYRTLPYFIAKAVSELPLVGLFNSLFGVIVYRLTGLSRSAGKFRRFLCVLGAHGLLGEAVGLAIGAFSPSTDVALALFPAFIVLNVIFDGRNVSEENTPKLLRWVPKFGLIRWAFEGLSVNEFDGMTFETTGDSRGPVAKTGADALSRFGLGKNSVHDVLRAQLSITGLCWVLSYFGLTLTRQKFMVMKPLEEKSIV